MEKIKDVEVQWIILHDLHDVMYMSIKPKENIETFKEQERLKVLQSLNNIALVTLGHITFEHIIPNLVCIHFQF
jgi:hypothetical protein